MIGLASLFHLQHSWLLVLSFMLMALSAFLFFRDKERIALVSLFAGAFLLRLFVAGLDPFLHEWDERVHALVARNMIGHPFKPMLRNYQVLDVDENNWITSHIWLHKQPLFLWQIAASLKMFGTSVLAVRLPSALMGALTVLLTYSIAQHLTKQKSVAFIAALLLCCSNFQLGLISGVLATDHNDVAFCFYVLLSLWAYIHYLDSNSWRDVMLIGLFAGCAVLNKWLSGLLVYLVWGINILLFQLRRDLRRQAGHMVVAVIISVAVFLPWQIYILHAFPFQARQQFIYTSMHLTDAVEGHSGTAWFYWQQFPRYFGNIIWVLVPAGLILLFILIAKNKVNKKVAAALITGLLFCFAFFSFVVATKMPAFFFIVAPLGFVCMALLVFYLLPWPHIRSYMLAPVAIALCMVTLDPAGIAAAHDTASPDVQVKTYNTDIYKHVKSYIPAGTRMVINVKLLEDIDVMFYNNDLVVYSVYYTDQAIDYCRANRIHYAVLMSAGDTAIIRKTHADPLAYIIDRKLK